MTRPPLNRTKILEAALEMADRDGLDGVTLRRLAAELRVHVTSLYNHVPTRDAVTEGIAELLMERAKLPSGRITWRQWVKGMAAAIRTLARRHPGAFPALYRFPATGPEALASGEAAIAAFLRAGFSPRAAFLALNSTSIALLGMGADEVVRSRGPVVPLAEGTVHRADLPNLRLAASKAQGADPWEYLVAVLIEGLAHRQR